MNTQLGIQGTPTEIEKTQTLNPSANHPASVMHWSV